MYFVRFNLSHYNSLDERLRLNHFKMIHQRIRVRHVPIYLSDDQQSRLSRAIELSTCCHVTYAHKIIKRVSHEKKSKESHVYKVFIHDEMAKILQMVLSQYLYTHAPTHVRTRAHSRTHTRAHKYTCVTRGVDVLSMPHQLPHQHAI